MLIEERKPSKKQFIRLHRGASDYLKVIIGRGERLVLLSNVQPDEES